VLNGQNASLVDGTEPDSTANKAEFSDHILATPESAVDALQRIRDELATALAKDKIAAMRTGGAA
jgi:hypothetical protein